MRQHDEQAALEAGLGQALREIGEIAPHDRFDIGVHDRGRDALIFLDLRQHVAGSRHADPGQFPGQPLDRGEFVDRIEIGVQEHTATEVAPDSPYAGDGLLQRGLIERNRDLAIGLQPFPNTEARSRGTSGSGGGERRS